MDTITEITRRSLVDLFTLGRFPWQGRLSEVDFLSRLYDLSEISSNDGKFQNAVQDINRHGSDGWQDWDRGWVFYDPRFNLLRAPDDELLRFLCETVHPLVRPDDMQMSVLVAEINRLLIQDGWELFEAKEISGRPVFSARKVGTATLEIIEEPTGWAKVDRQLEFMKSNLLKASNEEEFQAVGLSARETLISLAQAVYNPELHGSCDNVLPSETDVKRMLEAYLESKLSGGTNYEARAHAKTAVALALALQHRRTADYKMAAMCAEATKSCVNIVSILTDR